MIVHYLWIGSNKVPSSYFNNLNQCVKLNPTYDFMMWDDEKCLELLKEYKMVDYWNSLPTLISKCCMIIKCQCLYRLVIEFLQMVYSIIYQSQYKYLPFYLK